MFWQYIALGFVQGLTEFLPISSSGHLYLLEHFYGWSRNLPLEIILHFATLLAVVGYFRSDIRDLVQGFFHSANLSKTGSEKEGELAWKLLFATFITGIIGLATKDWLESFLTVKIVGLTLVLTGVLIYESNNRASEKLKNLTWTHTWLLGIIQAIAVVPGISRSGITIAFLLLLGLPRVEAARVSFLLSIPTIAGALVLALADLDHGLGFFSPYLWLGAVVAFVTAWGAIHWMLDLVKGKWVYFAPYCVVMGFVLLWLTR